ncbi:hypothetical protein AVEN_60077-1 [Araneus ventricosus]|uniref:Uncharacterized protein n=1 Tax=Araneus ventricosus TaxID=182803 RepID=A0A4Y2HZ16_ARAVE|nr:hypothetical protein AVEN_60077-1 [Araneus ventricosus]
MCSLARFPFSYLSRNENCQSVQKEDVQTSNSCLIENRSSKKEVIEELNKKSLNKGIEYRNKLLKDLLQSFRKEYLGQLEQKDKEKESPVPQFGELV